MPAIATVKKRNRAPKTMLKHSSIVWVVVRHTATGDKRVSVVDNREHAMEMAEAVADEAARNYGRGSASVFKGCLTMSTKPEMPK
jgi:hypothetical protein